VKKYIQTVALGALILMAGCSQKGFVKNGEMVELDTTASLINQAKSANSGQYKISYQTLNVMDKPMLGDIPVGAIIPHWGKWEFSDRWQICLGQVIDDKESPFYGQRVPDLSGISQPIYLAGSLNSQNYHKNFGKNSIPMDQGHTHSAKIGKNVSSIYVDKNTVGRPIGVSSVGHRHTISIKNSGAHNHGGDNRPLTFGLVYLIKIK